MQDASSVGGHRDAPARFQSAVLADPGTHARRKGLTLAISALLHTLFVAAVTILPLAFYDVVASKDVLATFLVSPLEAPPPPPPPPPPRGDRPRPRRVPPRIEPPATNAFVAPPDVPGEIAPEPAIDLGGGDGDPNGVEGGVPDGVVGVIVGGLPQNVAPPAKVVRVGGQLVAPERVRYVKPAYPQVAAASRVSAIVILEAQVDVRGVVKTVSVLRGHPLFDDAAVEAVKQWRYKPLLLNGEPTEFVLTVTVAFNLSGAGH
ncbi:MAG TPA: energy transducer TonB [Vicinamibacteria bacterium]|nr:energy transducer TonB [Vicinamibacteria bacterium]